MCIHPKKHIYQHQQHYNNKKNVERFYKKLTKRYWKYFMVWYNKYCKGRLINHQLYNKMAIKDCKKKQASQRDACFSINETNR